MSRVARVESLRDEVLMMQDRGRKQKKHRGGLMPRCRAKCELRKSYLILFFVFIRYGLPLDYIAAFVIVPELAGSLGLCLGIVVAVAGISEGIVLV